MEKIYRAVKYIRTSYPDDELHYRDSVANQRKLMNTYIVAHPDIMVVAEKVDNGYSGLFYDRPAFNEMIAGVKAGKVNCVIVKDLSRIGRDYIETGRYLRDLFPAHGVRLISIDDNIDSIALDGFEKTIALLKSIFSEQYSRDVSVKTRSALDAKRRQGKYVGAVPIYGYQKSLDDKNRLVPDPDTSPIVQSIFDMKLQGMSAAKIASTLDGLGVLSPLAYKRKNRIPFPQGGFADKADVKWSATTVLRILQDENYTGTLVQGRQRSANYKVKTFLGLDESEWVKVENAHPPLILKMDYDAVQRVMALDTRTPPGQNKVHIFSGMLICGCCGAFMTRKIVKNGEWQSIYCYCPTGKENGCHFAGMMREKELISFVTRKVKRRISSIKALSHEIPKNQIHEVLLNDYPRQVTEFDRKIHDLRNFRSHLYDSFISGIINDSDYRTFQDFYDGEIARLDDEKAALWHKLYSAKGTDIDSTEWMQYFVEFENLIELDRQIVVKLIRSIHIVSKEIIAVNFICQSEYEQALRYSMLEGNISGKKKQKTK